MKQKASDILYVMLSLTLAVDFINGLIPNIHFGEIFRIILIVVCLYIISVRDKTKFMKFTYICIFILINICFSTLANKEAFFVDIKVALKSVMVYVISIAIIVANRDFELINIEKIIINNLAYGPALFFASKILNFGNTTYKYSGVSIGFKSTFMSLNSVNIALLVLYVFVVCNSVNRKKNWIWILASAYVAIPMFMLGTKTSMVMIMIVPIMVTIINIKKERTWKTVIIIVTGIVVIGVAYLDNIYLLIKPLIERQKYLMQNRDLITYIFSTRNVRLIRVMKYYISNFNLIDLFPGRGYYLIHSYVGSTENLGVIPIEMDWADILVSYGPIGYIYTYVYSIMILWKNRRIVYNKEGQPFFLAGIVILLFGSLAGHLFLEAISSTFYAVVLAGCCNGAREQKIEKRCYKVER